MRSHHARAMQPATRETVLGDFEQAQAVYYTENVEFDRQGDNHFIEALAADGTPRRFPVRYTFGMEPLQQYLVETEPGRLQAFPFAWDARPAAAGGQRWYHLHPDEHVEPGDSLHWTGPSYNWNTSCADCHSTGLEKNYDAEVKRYGTEYAEVSVGCEACHGPGSRHVALAESGELESPWGFERSLSKLSERRWAFVEGRGIAVLEPSRPGEELETCAPCHSRRAELGGRTPGFHNRYRLATLDEHLYFADGQIKDEVYVYGSFLQSKMHRAGVLCSDCHEPHAATVRAEGNALCARCHQAEVYDSPQHHFHPVDSELSAAPGARCTDCHMPKRTYMGIDPRGDHRFGVPRPALSAKVGAPDVCTGCHRRKSAQWAEREIAKRFPTRSTHDFAEALFAARRGLPSGEAALIELLGEREAPAIARATALIELGNLGSTALPALLTRAKGDASALVRRSAAETARALPLRLRPEFVRSLLHDPARSVRIEAAATLLGLDSRGWKPTDRNAFQRAKNEYREARTFNADRADGLVGLGHLATIDGDVRQAESILREAITVDPTFTAAYVNLADLYRGVGRDPDSVELLREAREKAADRAMVEHALGLALVRLGRHRDAIAHLARAYALRPESVRFGYVYAVAQFDRGHGEEALATLRKVDALHPANREVLMLLVDYNRQLGRERAARRYAERLRTLGVSR